MEVSLSTPLTPATGRLLIDFLRPTPAGVIYPIKAGNEGLNIEKRGAVQHIQAVEVENVVFPADQFNNAQPDGVRPTGCTRSEHPLSTSCKKGFTISLIGSER